MAELKSYGKALPDQVDRIALLADAHIGLLSDVREIYKDRAALEKEYAGKLSILAKKAADRKSKSIASLVVGDDASTAWGEDTIQRSTLDKAYGQLISSLENSAQDHSLLSDVLITQVADATKTLEKKHTEMKSKQLQFYQKLLSDRDKVYAERLKMKQKYDEECLEIESYRRKQDRSQDDKHASRAAKQLETQLVDMQNSKNTFITSTAIANRIKGKFYTEDLPLIEDDFLKTFITHPAERLQTNLVVGLVSILLHAQTLQTAHLTALQNQVNSVQQALTQVNPALDQNLYISYNIRAFSVPNDWAWEPCAGYYDTGEMAIDPAPKVFLQNKLSRCKAKQQELYALIDNKKKDVEKLTNVISSYMNDRSLGSVDDVMNDYLGVQHQLTLLEVSATAVGTEIDTISDALGASTMSSKSTRTPSASSFMQPQTIPDEVYPSARALYSFTPTSPFELAVTEGSILQVIEDDDGSGWTKVADGKGGKGLVPASYVELVEEEEYTAPAIPARTKPTKLQTLGSGKYVRSLYTYQGRGPDELSLEEGELYELSSGSDGGQNYADGWWEGHDKTGKKGIFPSNYVELA
ncbi:hypothetical protein EW145_g2696 [Phellinidium pouzarii]|uniref:SH3 domain-containing protein n=1 Tax=Phellinidium pouzarii TaxID=167371 RepID=A0A4S4LFC0_9AGAM|nr:hypothetical protein EW145_g2696 [Phellinidium pouzarii]